MKKALLFAALAVSALTASAQYKQSYFSDRAKQVTYGPAPASRFESHNYLSFTLGYVNKEWVTEVPTGTIHENFWGEPDKRLHGVQFGVGYMPTLPFGLGLQTGLYLETYSSMSDYVESKGWDRFTEYSLYLPLHVAWDIRLTDNLSIIPFAGIGFNWAMYGSFEDDWVYRYGDYYDYGYSSSYYGPHQYERYGDGNPRHWNNQFEFGGNLRFSNFMVGFTYSKGLTDHHLYQDGKSYQNKLTINMSFMIDVD